MGRTVLVIGGGGREHALCLALSESDSIQDIHATPGNAGTQHFGTNHNVGASDIDGIIELSTQLGADFVVVGPEAPLCDGLADRLIGQGIPCFGPQQVHAELEGSKLFAKRAMDLPAFLLLSTMYLTHLQTSKHDWMLAHMSLG